MLSENASQGLLFAASELSSYIERTCGVKLEIVPAAAQEHVIELVIDRNGTWRDQGFTITSKAGKLTISGQSDTACLYGVYEFLESYIGWRFLTPDAQALLTPGENIDIPNGIEVSEKPGITYRSLFTPETLAGKVEGYNADNVADFWGQMRLNADDGHLSERQGTSRMKWAENRSCHTFGTLANGAHSLTEQPCFSDETVYQNMLARALKWLSDNPNAALISISQDDNNYYCQCENCQRVAKEEGTETEPRQSGPIIRFVNRIAEAIEKEYPDVLVHTFAYTYSEKPPLVTKARDNIAIQYCTISACFQHAINDPDCNQNGGLYGWNFNNAARAADIVEWGKVAQNIYIWDYGSSCDISFIYFPTLDVLLENTRFFAENNVKGIFLNGSGDKMPEFSELRTYMHAKVYWDPYMTEEEYQRCIDEFMQGYYGDAWEEMREYYDFLTESSNKSGFCFCDANYTTFRLFRRMDIVLNEQEINELFEKAKSAVEDDATILRRVEDIELTWQCAILSCRYMPDYIYGSDEVRAEYQSRTKALYDKCAERGYPSDIGHEEGDSVLPPYDPDQYPYQWFNGDEEKKIVGNQYV